MLTAVWETVDEFFRLNLRPTGEIAPEDAYDATLGLTRPFAIIGSSLKHRGFVDEREWRVVLDGMYWSFPVGTKRLKSRSARYMIAQHRPQESRQPFAAQPLPIVSSTIGPDSVSRRHTLQEALERIVTGSNTVIRNSEIPLEER